MGVTLFPHQIDALERVKSFNKCAFYMDMGLGKTYTGSEKMADLNGKINLVICQKSKLDDWIQHFEENYPGVLTLDLTNKAEFQMAVIECERRKNKLVSVINYDLIFRRPELSEIKFDTVMLDESSLVQNETSKRSKFVLKRLQYKNIILLSGTPTGGKYERLWSQCQLLGWNISKSKFWDTFIKYHIDNFNGFPVKTVDGYKNVELLKSKLKAHGAVFMKSEEVFDLPEQNFIDVKCGTSPAYRKFCRTSIVEYKGQKFIGDTTLTKILYMRMLCGFANAEKISAFKDLIESTDDRLIVFYNFTNELKALIDVIGDRPVSIVSGEKRDLTAYEKSENSVTLIQYQAGSYGLNLQKANKIIYFTPPVSSEFFEQSKKRIHRINQKRTCYYYRLICKNSIEERIYKTLAMRRDYTERLFENGQ